MALLGSDRTVHDPTVRAHKLLVLRPEVLGASVPTLRDLAHVHCSRGDLQEAEFALRGRLALLHSGSSVGGSGSLSVRVGCAMRELAVLLLLRYQREGCLGGGDSGSGSDGAATK